MPIVHDWLARRASLAPERVALIDALRDNRRISWREWNAAAHRTALLLLDLGVTPGDRVSVLAYNGVETLDLLFACAKLGSVLQPLNWRLGVTELRGLLADVMPQAIFFGPEFRSQVDALRPLLPQVLHWIPLADPLPGESSFASRDELPSSRTLPVINVEPDSPWVLCSTGGSTGLPKSAVLTHGSLTANAANTVVSWGLTQDDVALLNAPLFHTGGLNVFTLPLVYVGGASVVCRAFDVEQTFDLIH
ncbi:MAG: long-chain fatty acid--CoA ligase, partial [Myxococcaceae bacterium]